MAYKSRVSDAVVRRLPMYYRHLRELEKAGVVRISSQELGERVHQSARQHGQRLPRLQGDCALRDAPASGGRRAGDALLLVSHAGRGLREYGALRRARPASSGARDYPASSGHRSSGSGWISGKPLSQEPVAANAGLILNENEKRPRDGEEGRFAGAFNYTAFVEEGAKKARPSVRKARFHNPKEFYLCGKLARRCTDEHKAQQINR